MTTIYLLLNQTNINSITILRALEILDLDLSLANADIAAAASPFGDFNGDGVADAVIMVKMVNFFAVNGWTAPS